MDQISFRIKENFRVTERANFNTEFFVRNFSQLSPKEQSRSKQMRGNEYLRKFTLHPIKDDEDTCYPSVEIYEKANAALGRVEYDMAVTIHSIPKMLFGNNFEEIKFSDRDKVVLLAVERLRDAGILVSGETIKQAPPSVVHFCKNIILPKEIAIRSILSDLSHTDMGKAYDTTEDVRRQRDKNNSKVVHLRCGTREWCFYDKVDDMRQPNKRQDKVRTTYEKELVSSPSFENLEVFRYEYRLNKHQTIKSELHALLGKIYQDKITVSDLFTEGLWKAVLVRGWKNILKRPENQLALLSYTSSLDLLIHILRNAKSENSNAYSQNKALWAYGLTQAIQDHGAKLVKNELNKVWAKKDNRLVEKLDIATDLIKNIPLSQGVFYITQQLEKFEIISLASLENI